MNEEEKR